MLALPNMSTFAVLLAVCSCLAAGAAASASVREIPVPGGVGPRTAAPAADGGFPYAVAPMPLDVQRTEPTGLQIVGGRDAKPGEFPWQVSMQVLIPNNLWLNLEPQHICGGSLVSEGWVLTAAHCVWGVPQRTLRVDAVLGITNLADTKVAGAQRITVVRMLAHAKYDHYARSGVGPNDVAMLKLARKAVLSDTVKTIMIGGIDNVGTGTLSGWGSTSQDGSKPKYPKQLQTIELPIVTYKECVDFVNKTDPSATSLLAESNLCAGPLDQTGRSSCSGDSGGPLTEVIGADIYQVGIVSWGLVNCGSIPFPSVFTRVSSHYQWIRKVQANY